MEDIFGYKEVDEPAVSSSDVTTAPVTAPQTVPVSSAPLNVLASSILPKNPAAFQTIPDIGSGSEAPSGSRGGFSANATPYSTCAKGILPSSDQRRWS